MSASTTATGPPGPPPLAGHCDARFAAVQEAFANNFAVHDEVGAAVCIEVDGQRVVDLWGGHLDVARTRPWQRDTLVNVYSVGKGVLALVALCAVERGLLDLDAPVSRYWREFAAGDKGDVSVRCLLSHRAGLPAVRERLPEGAMLDWDRMCTALAGQEPYWRPDEAHGYHVGTLGYLVGETLRRATGLDVSTALERWATGPLGADFHFGLRRSLHRRAAEIQLPPFEPTRPELWASAFPPKGDPVHDEMIRHCYFNPSGLSGMGCVNTAAWREAVIPSTNGHGNARAVATLYASLLARVGSGPLAEFTRIHSDGDDVVLGRPSRFGLGFQISQPSRPIGPNAGTFGHWGYGGTLGFADPEAQVAFGYVMNRPGERWQTARTVALTEALYGCL